MKKYILMGGVLLFAFALSTSFTFAADNLLTNGSFETPTVSSWGVFPNGDTGLGWTSSEYAQPYNYSEPVIEIQHNLYRQAAEGNQYTELDSYGSNLITQTVSTVAGHEYNLSYSWSPRPDAPNNGLAVFINSTPVSILAIASMQGSFGWTPVTYNFTATSDTTTIGFAETGTSDQLGMFLDNVSFEQLSPTNKDQCKKGGWESYGVFKNQGDCVSFVATGGKNPPANQ